jgi:hypothetical protein
VRFDQHLQRCNVNVQSGQGAAATSHSQQSARSLTRSIQDFRDEQEEIRRLEREVAKRERGLSLKKNFARSKKISKTKSLKFPIRAELPQKRKQRGSDS